MIRSFVASLLDVVGAPLTLIASYWLRTIRRAGLASMPVSRRIFGGVGVFPIRRHCYEPFFDPRDLVHPLDRDRDLPGIDLNVSGQLALLSAFTLRPELATIPEGPVAKPGYFYDNGSFASGHAEYLYHMVRHFRP